MRWIALQKFRFDLGLGFMTILNFAFVVIAASDKIGAWLDIPGIKLVIAIVPTSLLCVWGLGYTLDKFKFWHAYQDEQNHRNKLLNEIHKSNT